MGDITEVGGPMNGYHRLTFKKEEWAKQKRGLLEDGVRDDRRQGETRLPPGQHVAMGWPVLDLGIHPDISTSAWTLTVRGAIDHPCVWDWHAFLAEPHIQTVSDFHCVTTWSTFDNHWEGVSFLRLLEVVKPKPNAAFVFFRSSDGYTTNLPLSACADDRVLLARNWNGTPLAGEHGGPVRVIVPKLYAWKGAKWIREIEFMERDRLGFWEVRGYSNTADPWTEDRYA